MNYLEILNAAGREDSLMWDRTSEGLFISTLGYNMQSHMTLESKLLKAGLRYDFSRDIQSFDRTNGRTTTYFKIPKTTAKNKGTKALLILILTCHFGLMAPQQSKASNLSDVQQLDRLYQELDEDCSNLEYESNECNQRQQEVNELAKQLGVSL